MTTFLSNSLLGLATLSVALQKVLRKGDLARQEGRRAHGREMGGGGFWVSMHTGVFVCICVSVCLSWRDPEQYCHALTPLCTSGYISGLVQFLLLYSFKKRWLLLHCYTETTFHYVAILRAQHNGQSFGFWSVQTCDHNRVLLTDFVMLGDYLTLSSLSSLGSDIVTVIPTF